METPTIVGVAFILLGAVAFAYSGSACTTHEKLLAGIP